MVKSMAFFDMGGIPIPSFPYFYSCNVTAYADFYKEGISVSQILTIVDYGTEDVPY